ncbi:MAG: hypothetical protein H7839_04885 [Magnetococcus sp. YQC-5]
MDGFDRLLSDRTDNAGCLALWLAVLDRAVRDAYALLEAAKRKPKVLDDHVFFHTLLELKKWFHDPSARVGGIAWICDLADIHPDRIAGRMDREVFHPLAEMMNQYRIERLKNKIERETR